MQVPAGEYIVSYTQTKNLGSVQVPGRQRYVLQSLVPTTARGTIWLVNQAESMRVLEKPSLGLEFGGDCEGLIRECDFSVAKSPSRLGDGALSKKINALADKDIQY